VSSLLPTRRSSAPFRRAWYAPSTSTLTPTLGAKKSAMNDATGTWRRNETPS